MSSSTPRGGAPLREACTRATRNETTSVPAAPARKASARLRRRQSGFNLDAEIGRTAVAVAAHRFHDSHEVCGIPRARHEG